MTTALRIGLIIAAGGQGLRAGGDRPKQFQQLAGRTVLERSLGCFVGHPEIAAAVVAVPDAAVGGATALLHATDWGFPVTIVPGGSERQETVALALAALPACDRVMVHDAARPLLDTETLTRALAAAHQHQAVCVALPVRDTIKQVPTGTAGGSPVVAATLDRSQLWAAQTPQIFAPNVLRKAHAAATTAGLAATDDAALVEALGEPVHLVEGSERNFKLTTATDFALAAALLGGESPVRTGFGYDVHRLVAGRPCILGGVEIPHALGLDGHSDADVLSHAIMDAMLGAAGLGDIGRHFPDTDEAYRDADSLVLMAEVRERIAAAGWQVAHIDATLVGEKPKLAPYAEAISERLAAVLAVAPAQVNIKASTNERLGFIGREEGLVAYAMATLQAAAGAGMDGSVR